MKSPIWWADIAMLMAVFFMLLAVFRLNAKRINFVALGLFFWILSQLLSRYSWLVRK